MPSRRYNPAEGQKPAMTRALPANRGSPMQPTSDTPTDPRSQAESDRSLRTEASVWPAPYQPYPAQPAYPPSPESYQPGAWPPPPEASHPAAWPEREAYPPPPSWYQPGQTGAQATAAQWGVPAA